MWALMPPERKGGRKWEAYYVTVCRVHILYVLYVHTTEKYRVRHI